MGFFETVLIVSLFLSGLLEFTSRVTLDSQSQDGDVVSEPSWNEAGRCGTNALYILLNTVREIPYSAIAKDIRASSQGSSLAELADASKSLGVGVECLLVPKNKLDSVATPYLMHLDLIEQGGIGHYITVIQAVKGGDGVILRYVDGGDGKTKILELDKLKGSYSGFLLVLTEKSEVFQKSLMLLISFGLGILLTSWAFSNFAK